MKCTNCGSEIAPNQAFCSTCGTPVLRQVNQVQGGPVNQNLGGQGFPPPPPPPRKKGGVPIWAFLITILLIVAIMLGVYFLVLRDNDSDDSSSSSSSSSRKKNNSDDEDEDDNKSSRNSSKNNTSENNTSNNITNTTNTPTSNSSSTYTVAVGDFIVKIPDNYIYETSTDSVAIVDEEETMLIQMWIKETPYTNVVAKKDELASAIRSSGATVSKVEEKTVNGTQCIVYEVSEAGQNYIYAVIRVNSMYSAVCVIMNADYTTYDYNILEKAVSIATTAEKSSSTTTTTTSPSSNNTTTTNLESKSTIDFDKIIE